MACTNINECALGTHECVNNSECRDTNGSYTCSCRPGYVGNGHGMDKCGDIDECLYAMSNCHPNATCRNTPGSYMCTCRAGFTGDGRTCEDIDECYVELPPETGGILPIADALPFASLHKCARQENCLNSLG